MPQPPAVQRGCVVVYVDESAPGFRSALAVGPVLTDPGTELSWVPLARPDVTVVEFGAVVDVAPVDAPAPISVTDPAGPVGVLAVALDLLATELIHATRHDSDPCAAHDPLTTFVRAVAPVRAALSLLAESDPDRRTNTTSGTKKAPSAAC